MPEPRRVLVVEDDDDQREALAALVAACGFRVVACRSYEEASASLAADHPDVLITDVRLSERNGLQLVNLAALKYPDTMRVVLTGYDDIDLRKEAARSGTQFLLKPLKMPELEAILRVAKPLI
ncbi:MAG TPA: response regulator [Vicinamibacterales bacterium]|jgi:DNA-binding NtrC family response regulator|nr:response regulator [Vicinamibacterales bacterium]